MPPELRKELFGVSLTLVAAPVLYDAVRRIRSIRSMKIYSWV